jgi:hypothetical protein
VDFYDALTRYVEDQSIKAPASDSARGRALGFTMAMLQRRLASSVYAVRRSLERMRTSAARRSSKTRRNTARSRSSAAARRLRRPDRGGAAGDHAASWRRWFSPSTRRRCARRSSELGKLIDQARQLESSARSSRSSTSCASAHREGIFADPKMKLLVFTEHKDTLDYLVATARTGAPGQAPRVGLTVTQIHGGMKIGDRDTPGTRIYAEREFRERPRSWWPPRPPARASTSSSAGS